MKNKDQFWKNVTNLIFIISVLQLFVVACSGAGIVTNNRAIDKNEQKRIVNKVKELIALCDDLKAKIDDVQTTQIHLADAIVEKALA